MHVRIARAPDAGAVETIRVRGWQAAYRHLLPTRELDAMPVDPTRWTLRLEAPPAGWTTFVAEHHGEIVGFAAVGPSRDESGIGELYAIYVAPAAWSTGAGRALIARAEEQLAAEYEVATLWVLEGNLRARRFYERSGWVSDGGAKTEEIWGTPSPEVRYRKRLRD
jgi:GNAT superfamily N-acetyltransferase